MIYRLAGCMGCMRAFGTKPICDHMDPVWARLEVYEGIGICASEACALWIQAWDAGELTSDQVKRAMAATTPAPAEGKLPVTPKYGDIAARINQRIRWFNAQKGAH